MVQERTEQSFRIEMKSMRQAQVFFKIIANHVLVLAKETLVDRRLWRVSEPRVKFLAVNHQLLAGLAVELLLLRLERPALQT